MLTEKQHQEWKKDLIELHNLQKKNRMLRKALKEIKEHENYLGVSSVYYDAQIFITVEQALKV